MSVAVELPALGESIVEGTVSRWLVKEGDRVELDQPLVEERAQQHAPAAGFAGKKQPLRVHRYRDDRYRAVVGGSRHSLISPDRMWSEHLQTERQMPSY